MTENQAYEEIARLTGQRMLLDQFRYAWVKFIRSCKELQDDYAKFQNEEDQGPAEFLHMCVETAEPYKTELWEKITKLDNEIDRLTRLAQNGAFDHE